MTDSPSTTQIDTLLETYELKDELRTGWELREIENPESVAAHTWGTAVLCLLFADDAGVDPGRAVSMALVHDLAEARTGDVATRAENVSQDIEQEQKEQHEREVMIDFVDSFDAPRFMALWESYEARETPLARFVKDMDLIDNCLQALKYERQQRYDENKDNENFAEYDRLDEFFATAEPRLRTEIGTDLFGMIHTRYERQLSHSDHSEYTP
ncbi:HD domain-containing protein [Halocatena pleomorpha]|uniref:5'-deoxynucleotidase n=1 Tax=Halocatena pleomorpha TaxID=1785090 RepID=A0A3P3RGG9_9EURY|nr:HD family hydrolase [Halocatena pleomorpha]RRJ31533.1 HD family hydrolase [Halocatena pleomorpha]